MSRRWVTHFLRLYRPLAESWWLYDGSESPPRLLAVDEGGKQAIIERKPFGFFEAFDPGVIHEPEYPARRFDDSWDRGCFSASDLHGH